MNASNLIDISTPEGEYYWVRCLKESTQPMVAERVNNGWFLTGCDLLHDDDSITVLQGPIPILEV